MDYLHRFDEYLNKALVNFDLIGLTAGVWVEDEAPLDCCGLDFGKAYGLSDVQTGTKLSPGQFSHMASISKTLTASAALLLYEEGKLHLDDRLCDLLPWLKIEDTRFKDITVHHLITHTSGLPAVTDFHWTTPDIDSRALKRYALSNEVKKASFVNTPGENIFSYSDMGFEILGNVIQEISGVAYEEFIADRLLEPLGIREATMLVFRRTETGKRIDPDSATKEQISQALSMEELINSGLVMPHMKDDKRRHIRQPYYPYNRRHAPSSTLNTNIFGMKKWGDAHMKRSVLSLKTYEQMWTTQTIVQNNGEGMGLGWFIRVQNGYTLYGHEGMDDGFRAGFWICPELKTQIVILANSHKAPVKKIGKELFDILTTS